MRNWVLDVSAASSAASALGGAGIPEAFGAFIVPRRKDGQVGCEIVVEGAEVAGAAGGVGMVGCVRGRRRDGEVLGICVVGDGGGGGGQGGLGGREREREDGEVKIGERLVLGLPAWDVALGGDVNVNATGAVAEDVAAFEGRPRKWTVCPVWRRI